MEHHGEPGSQEGYEALRPPWTLNTLLTNLPTLIPPFPTLTNLNYEENWHFGMVNWFGYAWKILIVCWKATERTDGRPRAAGWDDRKVPSACVVGILIYACHSPKSTACSHGLYHLVFVFFWIDGIADYLRFAQTRRRELPSCYQEAVLWRTYSSNFAQLSLVNIIHNFRRKMVPYFMNKVRSGNWSRLSSGLIWDFETFPFPPFFLEESSMLQG